MKITVEYHPHLDACTIRHESVHLEGPASVHEWRDLVMGRLLAEVGSRRVYLLVDYFGFTINPAVAEEYGEVAHEIRRRYAKDVLRYGATDPLSTASVRLQSMKHSYSSQVFSSREEALRALTRLRERQ